MARKPHVPRNRNLARGISRLSRSAVARKTRSFLHSKKGPQKKTVQEKKPVIKKFGKNETREIKAKGPRTYPADDVKKPLPSRKSHHKAPRVRASLVPGTVLIVLAGRFRAKRVILLKSLKSGLLLITGPFKLNGVPLRRINQAYVIATSTRLDVSSLKIDEKFNDDYFRKPKADKKKKTEAEFFSTTAEKPKKVIDATRSADQKAVDAPLLALVKKTENLKHYLKAKFSLKRNQYPHEMKF